jgi:hypothetical protein
VNPSVPVPTVPLIFNWEAPQRRKLAFTGFLGASVLAHAICFYVFQIVYPPMLSLLPPPARVSVVSPNTEDGRTLLQWIEAEDPALASTTLRPPDTKTYGLPKVEHVPSYSGYEPALKPAPPLIVDLRSPSTRPPGPVPMSRPDPPPAIGLVATYVSFSQEIENLGSPIFPPTKFIATTSESPERIRFHIGVSDRGEVRYCFPLNSSGDPALDEQARKYLVLSRFPPRSKFPEQTENNLSWGSVTIEWGNDVERAHPTSSATPRP